MTRPIKGVGWFSVLEEAILCEGVYQYFRTRQKNPLKGKQAIITSGCKLIRVFYAILKKGVDYDPRKLRMDIVRPNLEAV